MRGPGGRIAQPPCKPVRQPVIDQCNVANIRKAYPEKVNACFPESGQDPARKPDIWHRRVVLPTTEADTDEEPSDENEGQQTDNGDFLEDFPDTTEVCSLKRFMIL